MGSVFCSAYIIIFDLRDAIVAGPSAFIVA